VISPLTLGLLVVGVYMFWLRRAAGKEAEERRAVSLTAQSIVAALLAVSFWWGCGLILLNILENIARAVKPTDWATALAFVITGIGYIPLDILLRRQSTQAVYTAPLRGFVLTLLGGGILAGAIGGATALYAYGTSLLGSPLDNWQYAAHAGLAAFVVGLVLVALYLWTGIREGFFRSTAKEETAPAPSAVDTTPTAVPVESEPVAEAAASSSSVANIVDNLLSGKITRDEAIMQIEQVVKQTV
jgi:hypothetical protein